MSDQVINKDWVNLASAKLGAEAVYANDDFFADKSRLILDSEPIFIPDKYDDNGKWMDGWESRRKRGPGYDNCVVKLARTGIVKAVVMDTSHFTGNYPPEASLEGCHSSETIPGEDTQWQELVPRTVLQGDTVAQFGCTSPSQFSHVRLNIFPDGGMARLNIFGDPARDWESGPKDGCYDLAARLNGGSALYCNDEHFGSMHNLIAPGRGVNMGDGWETRRRREPGNDWVILKLGAAGVIEKVVVDTAHFKGNYPDSCSLKAAYLPDADDQKAVENSAAWKVLLPAQKLRMDNEQSFTNNVASDFGPITHVRMDIFPDGGVSRLRLFGKIVN